MHACRSTLEDPTLTGRIAVVLRYEPLDEAGKSQWSQVRFSQHASVAPKMEALAKRHAAGIILVNPPAAVDGKKDLETPRASARFGDRLEIPVFQMTPEAMDSLIEKADAEHRNLMKWRRLADNGEVTTANLGDDVKVTLTSKLEIDDRLKTANVGGVLRGKGSLADQWIIIGGHFDHVGFGYTGAMPNNVGKLHPGADDNASGTAAVLIAAERLKAQYDKAGESANLRSILFLCFSAEEAGLFGSAHYVEHPTIATSATTLMINMDMVGRLRSDNLFVQGVGTAQGLEEELLPLFEKSGLTISKGAGGSGPSDHANFFRAGIPVLFMFTGEHDDYHKPSDFAWTVNPGGAIKVVDLVEAIAMEVSKRPQAFTYIAAQGAGSGRPSAARVRLGVQPAYAAELETGVLVEAVSEGTSAADAGIKAGDVMLSWDGQELDSPRKLFELLGKAEPGNVVKMVIRRDGKEQEIPVTLKGRPAE